MQTRIPPIRVPGDRSLIDRAMVERPLRYLAQVNRACPGLSKRIDELRDRRKEIGDWPNWCFLPVDGVYQAALMAGRQLCGHDMIATSAVTAWRPTQGVYRFDDTLLEELWRTPVEGVIPIEVLQQLPEWCCYIAFPKPRQGFGEELRHGFFVQLEYDLETGAPVLQLTFDSGWPNGLQRLAPTTLRLAGNLTDSLAVSLKLMEQAIKSDGGRALGFESPEVALAYLNRALNCKMSQWLAPYISIVLYLCSTAREINSQDGKPPEHPHPIRTRRDDVPRIIPPARPAIHECGFRLGATLRAGMARAEAQHASAERGQGTHASPRAHLRRAHWHCYWTGPLSGQRKIVTKWLHPILVGAGEAGEDAIIPTVHRVASPLQGSTAAGRNA